MDEVANEDAVPGSSSPSHARGGEEPSSALSVDGDVPSRRSPLRQDLFGVNLDYKHDDDGDSDDDASHQITTSYQRSKSLPKIVYSKLVTLSLSNFAAYRESIKVSLQKMDLLGRTKKVLPKHHTLSVR